MLEGRCLEGGGWDHGSARGVLDFSQPRFLGLEGGGSSGKQSSRHSRVRLVRGRTYLGVDWEVTPLDWEVTPLDWEITPLTRVRRS
eukprot:883948-Pyramimonas_sp.AAC.1